MPTIFIRMLSWWPSQSNSLPILIVCSFIFLFLSLHSSPAWQKSVGSVILRTSNFSDLLLEMPRYCCPVEIFHFGFLVFYGEMIEIYNCLPTPQITWSWQAVLNFIHIFIKFHGHSNTWTSPEAGQGNCLLYVLAPPSLSCESRG